MPLRKKKNFTFRKFAIIAIIALIIILMIIYFAPTQNITEVVLA